MPGVKTRTATSSSARATSSYAQGETGPTDKRHAGRGRRRDMERVIPRSLHGEPAAARHPQERGVDGEVGSRSPRPQGNAAEGARAHVERQEPTAQEGP